jgi:hypothetical protein
MNNNIKEDVSRIAVPVVRIFPLLLQLAGMFGECPVLQLLALS